MYPFAVRTNPGGTVTQTPFVFGKTSRAYFKPTGAAPAKGLLLFAAMTVILFFLDRRPMRRLPDSSLPIVPLKLDGLVDSECNETSKSQIRLLHNTENQQVMAFPPSVARLFTTPTILMAS